MTRMLRLRKIIAFMNLQQGLKTSFKLFSLIMLLLLIIHWVGCLYYIVISTDYDTGIEWLPPLD